MKKQFLTVALAVMACACGGPIGGEEEYDLDSGSYEFSNTSVAEDTCGYGVSPTDFNGYYTSVTIVGDNVIVGDGVQMNRSGNDLSGSWTQIDDYRSDLDCVLTISGSDTGTVEGDNEFTWNIGIHAAEQSGTECFVFDLPCSTRVSTRLTRL